MSRIHLRLIFPGVAAAALLSANPAQANVAALIPHLIRNIPTLARIGAGAAAAGAAALTAAKHSSATTAKPSASTPAEPGGPPSTKLGMCGSKNAPCMNTSGGKPPRGGGPSASGKLDKPMAGRNVTRGGVGTPGAGSLPESQPLGQLVLRFDRRADFRHLVYTVTYQPASTDPDDEVYALRGQSLVKGVAVLGYQQAQAVASQLRWPHNRLPRMCQPTLRLGPGTPSCLLVLGVTPDVEPDAAARGDVRYFATRAPSLVSLMSNEQLMASPDAVDASTEVAMKDTFFVALKRPHHITRLFMVQRDLGHPDQFRKTTFGFAPHQFDDSPVGMPTSVDQLELSHDGSRLYIDFGFDGQLWEWAGRHRNLPAAGTLLLHELYAGRQLSIGSIGAIGVIKDGVCALVYVPGPQMVEDPDEPVLGAIVPRLICKRQDKNGWSARRYVPVEPSMQQAGHFPRILPRYAVATQGDSLMVALRGRRAGGALDMAYVRDAMDPNSPVVIRRLNGLTEQDGAQLTGLLPLGAPAGRKSQWLLFGRFLDSTSEHVAPLRMLNVLATANGSPVFRTTPAFGSYSLNPQQIAQLNSHDSACVLTQSKHLVRIIDFEVGGSRLQQIVLDTRAGRALKTVVQQAPEAWGSKGVMRMLRGSKNTGILAVAASDPVLGGAGGQNAVWLYTLSRSSQTFDLPVPVKVSFQAALEDMHVGDAPDYSVRAISQNTLMLLPVVSPSQDNGSGLYAH